MAGTIVVDTLKDGSANTVPATTIIKGAIRAWVNFKYNGTSIVINASFNVSSVVRNGTGDYTINFTTAMADVNYCVGGTAAVGSTFQGNIGVNNTTAPTTTAVRIGYTLAWGGPINSDNTNSNFMVTVNGN